MKKTVLVFGIITGAIVGSMLFITMPMYDSGILNFDNGELVGYTTMVIALSLVFFGVRSYRDNYREGILSFGEAMLAGSLITLVASLVYALSWEVCYQTIASDFTEKFSAHYLQQMKDQGKTTAEIAGAAKQMEEFKEMYKNPVIRFGYTLLEILPVGIVITLLSALLLKKRKS